MKTITKTVSIVLLGLALTACGGGGESTNDNTSSDTTTADEYKAMTEALLSGEVDGVSPYDINTVSEFNVANNADSALAIEQLNAIRKRVGLMEVKTNTLLEKSATNHANYLTDVATSYNTLMGHYEDNSNYPSDFYTGRDVTTRVAHTQMDLSNYNGVDEDLVYGTASSKQSLKSLMVAIYHRFSLLSFDTVEAGAGNKGLSWVFNIANQTSAQKFSNAIVVYPSANQKEVTREFVEESPDPLPNTSFSGNPISIAFNPNNFGSIEILSFKLFKVEDGENTEVGNTLLMDKSNDPHGKFTTKQFALFPLDPLEASTTYHVEVEYLNNDNEKSKSWEFTTTEGWTF